MNSNKDWKQILLPVHTYVTHFTFLWMKDHITVVSVMIFCLVRLYFIFKTLTADRVFWKCFTLPKVCLTFSKYVVINGCFDRPNESQHCHTHLQPASPVPTSHLCTLSLALYSSHFHFVLLIQPQPPRPDSLGSQSPEWNMQLVQQRGPARSCFLAVQIQASGLICPRHSPRHPDLVQLCCCTLHHRCYTSQIIMGLSCLIFWKE